MIEIKENSFFLSYPWEYNLLLFLYITLVKYWRSLQFMRFWRFWAIPRKACIDAPGALHHIIIQGIERRAIFEDPQDYQSFIERLGNILTDSSTPCYVWALLTNHVHLLLRTGMVLLATVMRRLLTGYAQQFNRRHRRHGHLFQNPYKSSLCEEDPYLLELQCQS